MLRSHLAEFLNHFPLGYVDILITEENYPTIGLTDNWTKVAFKYFLRMK